MPKVIQVRNFSAVKEDEWRVLSAIETGMRNHEYVKLEMLHQFSGMQRSWKHYNNIIKDVLIPNRLIAYDTNGFRLTNLGYDFLALHKFIKSGIVYDLSNFQFFATGKESDLYVCKPGEKSQLDFSMRPDIPIVLKFHRLGRTSFKQVKNKREYKTGNSCSWLYMNRISAAREYNTMKILYEAHLPVPTPLCHNRGAVAMEYIYSCPLFKFPKYILEKGAAGVLYLQAIDLLVKLAQLGLVHGDFNEFNMLVEVSSVDNDGSKVELFKNDDQKENHDSESDSQTENSDEGELEEDEEDTDEEEIEDEDNEQTSDEKETENEDTDDDSVIDNADCPYINQDVNTFKLRMIDFPQVISRNNKEAQEIYSRDRHGVVSFFRKFTNIDDSELPPANIDEIERVEYLDVKLRAPGYPKNEKISSIDADLSDEESTKTPASLALTFDQIKKKVLKEKSKAVKKERFNKQQRNMKKKEYRNELKTDIFL